MKISLELDKLLLDSECFQPNNLFDIIDFVRNHYSYFPIFLILKNSEKSCDYLYNQCKYLIKENNIISDIKLASLIVIIHSIDNAKLYEFVSRMSASTNVSYHWSLTMAISFMLSKEVYDERLYKSA